MNTQHTTTPRKKDEKDIKADIKKFLEERGWVIIFLVVSNKDGFPDVIANYNNARAVYIETKVPGKNPSPIQLFRHQQLRQKGFEVIIGRSVDDVRHLANYN